MVHTHIAISPYETLSNIYSQILNVDFSIATLINYSVFFILTFFFIKDVKALELFSSVIGLIIISSLIKIFSITIFTDFENIFIKILIYLFGYTLYIFGSTYLVKYNKIMTPFDKFQKLSSKRYHKKPGTIRIIIDIWIIIIAIIIKYIFNIPIDFGIMTVVLMITTGSLINKTYEKI